MRIERIIDVLEEWQDLLTNVASEEFSTAYSKAIEICKTFKNIRGYVDNLSDVRKCRECGKVMHDGYVIRDGEEYYCSQDCLSAWYSEEEFLELYEADEAYWTEWEDDDE